MKGIGILETILVKKAKQNSYSYLLIEKILIESKYDWLRCVIDGENLFCRGFLKLDKGKYEVMIKYSYNHPQRFERIWIASPSIKFHKETHMYFDNTLCLYYPKDLPATRMTPLVKMLPWVSEWIIKYEFWKRYKVWIGEEAPHN